MRSDHYILTVTNYSPDIEEDAVIDENTLFKKTRITLAPHHVLFIISSDTTYCVAEGRELRRVNVIFTESSNMELYISEVDLMSIEKAVGSFFIGDE
jgi:hypothetical protein